MVSKQEVNGAKGRGTRKDNKPSVFIWARILGPF